MGMPRANIIPGQSVRQAPFTPQLPAASLAMKQVADATPPKATTIIIDAGITIQGHANIVTVPSTNIPQLTATVLAALRQQSDLNKIGVQINCSTRIVGTGNIIRTPAAHGLTAAQVAARQAVNARAMNANNAVNAASMAALRKRKVEEATEAAPEAKRQASDAVGGASLSTGAGQSSA